MEEELHCGRSTKMFESSPFLIYGPDDKIAFDSLEIQDQPRQFLGPNIVEEHTGLGELKAEPVKHLVQEDLMAF